MNKKARQARRRLSHTGQQLLTVIEQWETVGIVALERLCLSLEGNTLHFVTFSCLGSYKGKAELKLDLFETFFLRSKKYTTVQRFIEEVRQYIPVRMTVVLPDMEPRRTWGWDVSQESLTEDCQLMILEGEDNLPEGWRAVCWSDLEARCNAHFETALHWARQPAQHILVHQEDCLLRQYPEILFVDGTREAATRQVAAYAHEGLLIEQLYPHAILLQTEDSPERKDRMYQPLREHTLPIIHPVDLR